MDEVSVSLFSLLNALLPGLLAAWVFYGLTAHPRPSAFERIVQALVFTAIVRAAVLCIGSLLVFCGRYFVLGPWNADVQFVWSIGIAMLVGLLVTRWANSDALHSWLRKYGWTSRTSFPSEWYSSLQRTAAWVILDLKDGRRLFGWPEEWPDRCDQGHFVLDQAEWISEDKRTPIEGTRLFVVPASMVEFVEIQESPNSGSSNRSDQTVCAYDQAEELLRDSEAAAIGPEPQ